MYHIKVIIQHNREWRFSCYSVRDFLVIGHQFIFSIYPRIKHNTMWSQTNAIFCSESSSCVHFYTSWEARREVGEKRYMHKALIMMRSNTEGNMILKREGSKDRECRGSEKISCKVYLTRSSKYSSSLASFSHCLPLLFSLSIPHLPILFIHCLCSPLPIAIYFC